MPKHPLAGSERQPLPGAKLVGAADPAERLEVTILLRRRAADALKDRVARLERGDKSQPHLSRQEFAAQHGADPSDIAAVATFAAAHNLAVVSTDAVRRSVVLSGSVADFNAAFEVELQQYEHDAGSYRGRTGAVHLPPELDGIVQAVMGLDNRPQAHPHFRHKAAPPAVQSHAAAGSAVSYPPTDIAALYGFPAGTGQGQTIGIIELGGGSKAKDLTTYFKSLGLAAPKVVTVSIDHGRNHATGSADGPDGEVMLDIEVAGAVAPGATLVVYFSPNTDAGFLDAITTAVHDTTHAPSVISISWGSREAGWTQQSMTAFDQAFQDAATLGVTICVASGDDGSRDGATDGTDNVDFPASSPHVLACGGTSLRGSGGQIQSESVWNDGPGGGAGGGGVSAVFPLPSWQEGLSATKSTGASPLAFRGVPDIAGDADPQTGYKVRVDGTDTVIGGTSAVAPLWAGLIARLNAARSGGTVGFINPTLYANPSALNDITSGNNGSFLATAGWDACTGLGSPKGASLSRLFG